MMLAALLLWTTPMYAQPTGYQTPPPALARLVETPPTPGVSISPDRQWMLLTERADLPTIEDLAQPELRLGGLRLNPKNNGSSRGSYLVGLRLRPMTGGEERTVTGLPASPRIEEVRWSPRGDAFAFLLDRGDRIELWAAEAETARARRLVEAAVNPLAGPAFDWISDGSGLVARLIPDGRGPAPEPPEVPATPVIQENIGRTAPARTYQDLLKDAHDEALFEHYLTSELVRVGLDGSTAPLAEAGLYTGVSVSPDARYVLVQERHRPFSYLVPYYRFPNRIQVLDLAGGLVHTLAELGLQEEVPIGFGSVPTGVRSATWRADAPATLTWVEALDGGDARAEADARDRVFLLEAPFRGAPTTLATLGLRYSGTQWAEGGAFALVREIWWPTRQVRVHRVDPDRPQDAQVVFDYSFEDSYNDPGSPATRSTGQGTSVVVTADDGQAIFLMGDGASPEGERPFLRKMNLATGQTTELFRSQAPYYEDPVMLLDAEALTLLTRRETVTEPPNYFLRDLPAGTLAQLTDFPHPYPELMDVQKEFVQYERADGVPLTATLYLPAGYDPARDGPLPALVWAYPREFKSADAAGQVTDSPYRFNRISYWGALPYVTQGYAIVDNASMPIIGEGDDEPNDSFIDQLVMNAEAALEMGARRGVVDPARVAIGGHSYGAFMTANLLAHSDLFRAGIARSGAYNRSLTPFGFQREERTFWEAPEIYFAMSPFMHAHKVNEPMLLIHGAADNNSGTFPMQSERFYNAVKGHGGTVRLVMLPYESHGYRAKESLLHMLWEMNTWLDTYVKNAPSADAALPEVEEAAGR